MTSPPTPVAQMSLRDAGAAVGEAFARAAARSGTEVRHFRIAGHLVRVTFAGPALAQPLFEALSHLDSSAGQPDLSIRVFDSRSTGEPLPLSGDTMERLIAAGMPAAQAEDGFLASYHRPDSGLSFLDTAFGTALYWVPSLSKVPGWERGGTFRSILSWWMPLRGKRFVHSGAVGQNGNAVLLAGPSGSGKSTTAVTCFAAGMDYAGDDYCLVSISDARVHCLYRSAKLHVSHIALPPGLGPSVNTGAPGDEKGVFFPAPGNRSAEAGSMHIRALVLPTVTGVGSPQLRRTTSAAALGVIAPSTLLQLSAASGDALADLASLCSRTPAYVLELGQRMDLVPDLLRELL